MKELKKKEYVHNGGFFCSSLQTAIHLPSALAR
jgi:hypothetical protein